MSWRVPAEIDAWPAPVQARQADGWAAIESYTVVHHRAGPGAGIVIGRLEADGRRFIAAGDERDAGLLDLLSSAEPIGVRVYTRSFGTVSKVAASEARMNEVFPPEPIRSPG